MAKKERDYHAFRTVFLYCLNILVLPIATFFLSRCLFDGIFEVSAIKSNIFSAIAAVVALHIALAVFIFKAYFGDPKPDSKRD